MECECGAFSSNGPRKLRFRKEISTHASRPVDILLVQEHKLSYAHTQRYGKLLPRGSHTFWDPAVGGHLSNGGVCISVGSRWLARVGDHGTLVPGRAMWITLQCGASFVGVLCIYAPTTVVERSWFRDRIVDALSSVDSWIVGGDFNIVETFVDWRAAQPRVLPHIARCLIHPISCIYDVSYGESEISTLECRRAVHQRLSLPLDRPLLRVANALHFLPMEVATENQKQGRQRLRNVHINIPTGSGVVAGRSSIVQGSYEYYHYLQDNFNDNGWGCAYRSLQTIVSWFKLQHYTFTDVPTHEKIQETLVKIGDKDASFKGSQNWIGAIELSFVLDELLGVSSKILNVRSGAELPEKCRELALHFQTQGTPVMIGGGVLAYTLLGVDYNDTTGDCAFLILDPHYTGGEDLKTIWAGGWCGWKKPVNSKVYQGSLT
ncbi:hypothetical protein L7F22_056383 [Adiantum nelumboides]|nr:hypothetical protein [Adiantum nelumboides]